MIRPLEPYKLRYRFKGVTVSPTYQKTGISFGSELEALEHVEYFLSESVNTGLEVLAIVPDPLDNTDRVTQEGNTNEAPPAQQSAEQER